MGWRRRYGNPDGNQQAIFDHARDILTAEIRNTTAVGDGFPDGVMGWHGLTIMIEVKRPGIGKKLRESQERFRGRWKGGPYLIVDSGEDLVRQVLDLDRRVPPVRGLHGEDHPGHDSGRRGGLPEKPSPDSPESAVGAGSPGGG